MSLFHDRAVSTGTNESDETWEPEDFGDPEPEPKWFFVSLYLLDQAFGGHEEGGWYYTYGIPCQGVAFAKRGKFFTSYDKAREYRNKLQKLCKRLNKNRRPMSSVLSEGVYGAVIDEEHFPRYFPQQPPHYE